MVYRKSRGRLGASFKPTAQLDSRPASVGGVNAIDSLMQMPVQDCVYTYNMMPVEYGLRLRKGYKEWTTNLGHEVRSIVPYESSSQSPEQDRLFAVTKEGIYDASLFQNDTPTRVVDFTTTEDDAGFGVQCEFTADNGRHLLFYADSRDGVHVYETGQGWSRPSGWTYDDPDNPGNQIAFPVENVAFIMVHKLRLWVILEDSTDAWYLPIAAIAGELKKFTFGSKFIHGGNLQVLVDWTVDGGDGVDDYLVAVSRGGDVILYRGSDPEQPDWNTTGSWFIGEVPRSRRIAQAYGPDLFLLSTYGLTSLQDLLRGNVSNLDRLSLSSKINRFLRADVESGKDLQYWAVEMHPGDGFMQIVTPKPSSMPPVQYNMNLTTKAWGFWCEVPNICSATWNGEYFMGSPDGRVLLYDGGYDNLKIGESIGDPISFQTLTSFQGPNNHATFKRVGFIRTIGILAGTAEIRTQAIYDYEQTLYNPSISAVPSFEPSLWDSALWDQSVWAFSPEAQSYPQGTLGMGRVFAILIKGSSSIRLNIVGWDATYTEGGFL